MDTLSRPSQVLRAHDAQTDIHAGKTAVHVEFKHGKNNAFCWVTPPGPGPLLPQLFQFLFVPLDVLFSDLFRSKMHPSPETSGWANILALWEYASKKI